ncbi:MAG TPA: hypothetical protein VGS15_10385 [Candidatus Acidoferrales bacterium]|nr:hypothetical protein [Candidatus Acidoferrales bacterium]
MPILYGAVAYRADVANDYENEIASWELTKTYERRIGCPNGGNCDKTYMLLSEINASEDTVREQIHMIIDSLEHGDCANHPPIIRINPPR